MLLTPITKVTGEKSLRLKFFVFYVAWKGNEFYEIQIMHTDFHGNQRSLVLMSHYRNIHK